MLEHSCKLLSEWDSIGLPHCSTCTPLFCCGLSWVSEQLCAVKDLPLIWWTGAWMVSLCSQECGKSTQVTDILVPWVLFIWGFYCVEWLILFFNGFWAIEMLLDIQQSTICTQVASTFKRSFQSVCEVTAHVCMHVVKHNRVTVCYGEITHYIFLRICIITINTGSLKYHKTQV